VIPQVVQFFSSRLRVNRLTTPIKTPSWLTKCYQAPVDPKYMTTGVEADLLLFTTILNEPTSGYVAWATNCFQDAVLLFFILRGEILGVIRIYLLNNF
jgi:hypothetical protein